MRTTALTMVVLTLAMVQASDAVRAQERQMGGGPGLTLFADRNYRGRTAT